MSAIQTRKSRYANLAAEYAAVRNHTAELCRPLEIEDYVPQPSVDVSPPKWNIAHTTWFFEEMILKNYLPGYEVFNKDFGFLFNSYYNSIGKRTLRHKRGDLSRPTVKEVLAFRQHVDEKMAGLFAADLPESVRDLVILGLNHEQQHQELFITDLKYTFSVNPLFPVYRPDYALCEIAENGSKEYVDFSAGTYRIGYKGEDFCFDNELSRHEVFLDKFSIRKSLVTNAEYREFIDAGAYEDFRLWHSDGWEWVAENEVNAPLYWHLIDGEWFQFTLSGLRKMNWDAPVCHISLYEAAAFAEWSNARLPTEFEWEAASALFDWGLRWEWTNSAYLPYPGFTKAAGAVGEYNGKFMINQMVLRGASVATPAGHSRNTYRNFFQPNLRWQFTGIRLTK